MNHPHIPLFVFHSTVKKKKKKLLKPIKLIVRPRRFNSETFSTALLLSIDERALEITVILNSGYYMAAQRIAERYNTFWLEKRKVLYLQAAIGGSIY